MVAHGWMVTLRFQYTTLYIHKVRGRLITSYLFLAVLQ